SGGPCPRKATSLAVSLGAFSRQSPVACAAPCLVQPFPSPCRFSSYKQRTIFAVRENRAHTHPRLSPRGHARLFGVQWNFVRENHKALEHATFGDSNDLCERNSGHERRITAQTKWKASAFHFIGEFDSVLVAFVYRRASSTRFCSNSRMSFFVVSSVRLPCASNRCEALLIMTSGWFTACMFKNTNDWRRWYCARALPSTPMDAPMTATGLPAQ